MKQITNAKQIGDTIRKNRRMQHIDQETLSMLCGFSLAPIKDVEAGRGSLSVDKLLKMLDELGIKLYLDGAADE